MRQIRTEAINVRHRRFWSQFSVTSKAKKLGLSSKTIQEMWEALVLTIVLSSSAYGTYVLYYGIDISSTYLNKDFEINFALDYY